MVIRYDHDGDLMTPCSCGEWIMADDYETLNRQYEDLQDKYDSLVKKLGELYQEG